MSYPILCILGGGPLYQIWAGERWVVFEWHHYSGPMPLERKSLEPVLLGPRHPFWKAVQSWIDQGKKIGREVRGIKNCVWRR